MVHDGHDAPRRVRLEDLAARCRAQGVKATPQRLEVFRALVESTEHPSPEAIFQVVQGRMPTISLGTIYKTLDALEEAGLARLVAHAGDTKRYDGNLSPHHHLVCRGCGRIVDFHHEALDAVELPRELLGFRTDELEVQVTGECEACAS